MTLVLNVFPWLVLALLVLAFSLADDLPRPRVERLFGGGALALIAVAALCGWLRPAVAFEFLLVAAGPPAFLLVHRVLRRAFRTWKGAEPTLVTTGRPGGRFFREPDEEHTVTWHDYLFSFLLGMALLLAAAPAIGTLIGRSF